MDMSIMMMMNIILRRNLNNIKIIKKLKDFDKYVIKEDFHIFRTFPFNLSYTKSLGDINYKKEELG